MKLEVTVTNYIEEKDEITRNNKAKLVLENRLVSLPDPLNLIDGWFTAPYNLTNTIFQLVNTYLKETYAGKAFKIGKSL